MHIKPTSVLTRFVSFLMNSVFHDDTTNKLQEGYYKATIKATSKRNHYFELALNFKPFESFDFYDPRVYGRFLQVPRSVDGYLGVEFNSKPP
jgi:hypothetical protein